MGTMANKQKRFEVLVNALSSDLYRYAYWLCGQPAQAEDLVQETFLRAWRALDSLKDDRAAKSWLLTIVRREHARLYERYTPQFADIDEVDIEARHELGPEALAERQQIHQAIASLEPEYREPLLLQVLEGCSGEEIADMLNLNKNTVMTRLHRARSQLREKLTGTGALPRKNRSS